MVVGTLGGLGGFIALGLMCYFAYKGPASPDQSCTEDLESPIPESGALSTGVECKSPSRPDQSCTEDLEPPNPAENRWSSTDVVERTGEMENSKVLASDAADVEVVVDSENWI